MRDRQRGPSPHTPNSPRCHLPRYRDARHLELLERLPKEKAPCIVFLTAHEEFALNAFDLEALDYLLKPVDDERFGACLKRVRRMLSLYQRELLLDQMYGAVDDRGSIRDEDAI